MKVIPSKCVDLVDGSVSSCDGELRWHKWSCYHSSRCSSQPQAVISRFWKVLSPEMMWRVFINPPDRLIMLLKEDIMHTKECRPTWAGLESISRCTTGLNSSGVLLCWAADDSFSVKHWFKGLRRWLEANMVPFYHQFSCVKRYNMRLHYWWENMNLVAKILLVFLSVGSTAWGHHQVNSHSCLFTAGNVWVGGKRRCCIHDVADGRLNDPWSFPTFDTSEELKIHQDFNPQTAASAVLPPQK